MKFNVNKKQTISIAVVLVLGALLAMLILGMNKAQPDEHGDAGHAETAGHGDKEHGDEKAGQYALDQINRAGHAMQDAELGLGAGRHHAARPGRLAQGRHRRLNPEMHEQRA